MKANEQNIGYSWQFTLASALETSRHCLAFLLFVTCLVFAEDTTLHARELPQHEITADENDYALREAMFAGNFEQFEHYLSLGADPTEWLDDSQNGWVFCAATDTGREQYLRLLIERDFDVNFRQVDISSAIALPLTCAVRYGNLRALEILVAAGADPSVSLSAEIPNRIPMSVMSQALIVGKYELAVWLFDKGDFTEEQLRSDIGSLEMFPVDESTPGNTYRLKLAELLREKGYEVTPWTREKSSAK